MALGGYALRRVLPGHEAVPDVERDAHVRPPDLAREEQRGARRAHEGVPRAEARDKARTAFGSRAFYR